MIDDIQDQFTAAPADTPKTHSSLKSILMVIIVWVIFTVVVITLNIRGLARSLGSSTPAEMVETAEDAATKTVTRKYTLYFVMPDGKTVKPFEAAVKVTGATEYQEAIDGLLQGPSNAILGQGAVTYIPVGTRLLGITLNNDRATVNLNEGFLKEEWNDPDHSIAEKQILNTLRVIDPTITDLTILVNGNPL